MSSISLSDIRYRSGQEGDLELGGDGVQDSSNTGKQTVSIKNIKYRAHQEVSFDDNLSDAPLIQMDGQPEKIAYGTLYKATEEDWIGYGSSTVWAKFKAPYSGKYNLAVEDLSNDEEITVYAEIWEFTNDDPQGYGDVQDFWTYTDSTEIWENGNAVFGGIQAGSTLYILVYAYNNFTGEPVFPDFSVRFGIFNSPGTTINTSGQAGVIIRNPRDWVGGHTVSNSGPTSRRHEIFLSHEGDITFEIERTWGGLKPKLELWIWPLIGSTLTKIAESDNGSLSYTLDSTRAYRIVVSGLNGTEGGYILNWSMPEPPGNYIDDPIVLSGNSLIFTVSTHRADGEVTREIYGEELTNTRYENIPASVWYSWTPDADGWVTMTLSGMNPTSNMRAIAFKGTTFENIVKVAETGNISGGIRTLNFPVKAGQQYRIMFYSFQQGGTCAVNFSNNTTHTPISFSDSNTYSFSSVGSYQDFVIYSAGNPYAQKQVYISFKMRYGSSANIPNNGTDHVAYFGEILGEFNNEILAMGLYHTPRSWTVGNNKIFFGGGPTIYTGHHLTQDWVQVEIYYDLQSGISCFTDGRLCGYGAANDSQPSYDACTLRLGNLYEGDAFGLTLEFKDIVIRDVWNRDFDYKPEMKEDDHRVYAFTGFEHNYGDTSPDVYDADQWSGYLGGVQFGGTATAPWINYGTPTDTDRGRATRFGPDGSALTILFPNNNLGGGVGGTNAKVTAFSGMFYFESLFTGNDRIFIAPAVDGASGIYMTAEGNLYIKQIGSGGPKKWLSKRIDTGRWHCIEIVYDIRFPQTKWSVYLNEDLLVDEFVYAWSPPSSGENIYSAPYIFTPGRVRMTDLAIGVGYHGKLGAFKTAFIKPNSSVDLVVTGTGNTRFEKSSDDGITSSTLTLGDNPHTYIDSWPISRGFNAPNPSQTALREIQSFSACDGNYIEVGFENMPAGETPVALNVLEVGRSTNSDSTVNQFPGYHNQSEVRVSTRIMSNGKELRGTRHEPMTVSTTSSGMESEFPYNSEKTRWTETDVNNLTVRWGGGGGGFAGAPDHTSVLTALGIEVLMEDVYPPSAPDTIITKPVIEVYNGWEGNFDTIVDFNYQPVPTLSGCDTYAKRSAPKYSASFRYKSKAIDPYVLNKIGWHVNIFDIYSRSDLHTYWRLIPAYDLRFPGFDGDFHDTDTDRANGTTSWDMLTRWIFPTGYDWNDRELVRVFPYYPPHDSIHKSWPIASDSYGGFTTQLEYSYLLYSPCLSQLAGKLDENNSFTIEAYSRHKDSGIVSETQTLKITFRKGCCGNIVVPIKYRAFQEGDLDS